jgi:hypothetical protein
MSAARQLSHNTLSQDLYRFAVNLRQLAYTMPGGAEDPLIRLSERMVRHAQQEGGPERLRGSPRRADPPPPRRQGDRRNGKFSA